MEFVLVYAILLFQVFLIDLLEVVKMVRAFDVNTLVDDKVLMDLLVDQHVTAVGVVQGILFGKAVVVWGEVGITDLALDLSLGSVVAVKIRHWSVTAGTGAILRDITFFTPGNSLDFLVVPIFKVGDKELPVPFTLMELNFWEIIRFEPLVLLGV